MRDSKPVIEVAGDHPKSLRTSAACESRQAFIREPHVAPLTEFVLKIREETGHGANIPFFDPFDGGISAQCLFLLVSCN